MNESVRTDNVESQEGGHAEAVGPGTRLRERREEQGRSVGQVANQLHLEPRLITALEDNDYDHLPEPIYVTGYLRNYARLLKLPEDEIVAAYQQLNIPPPPIMSELTRPVRRLPGNQAVIQWGIAAVVAVAVVLLAWQWGAEPPADASRQTTGDQATQPSTAPEDVAQRDEPQEMDLGRLPEEIDQEVVQALQDTPAQRDDSSQAPEATAVQTPEQPPGATPGPGDRSAAITPPPSGASQGRASSGPTATIELRFDDDSWVEVTDATGERVFFDLGEVGQVRTVRGMPPFKILLGYSPGVSIEYNGEPFDQSPFTRRNNVARFTLGGQNG